ncbi:hypothetical protein JL107_03610 [Nakamurella flavida]|uniref:GH26 domain-containing protein n=1 Tax=Nakamurella flavida TaxID=363630 RepID=A0A938YMA7_9ACTN|nr:glycosyl hydrolase [Nakamurella flavida]MBM9475525.1 hypothetical protein [Nakamurella flavida]MDP9778200.1 hypothetical protein [Nakamurella flavida]
MHTPAAPPRAGITRRGALRTLAVGGAALALTATTGGVAGAGPAPLLQRATWGAYASRVPFPDAAPHYALEALVGTRFPQMSWFSTWGVAWPKGGGQQAARSRHDLLVAWQPTLDGRRPVLFSDIVAGRHDDYLTRFFTAAARHPGRVTVRFAHEPNGTGYPWSVAAGGCVRSTAEYVAGWRYVVEFHRRISRRWTEQNVRFCWCVTTRDRGGIPLEEYYPGDDWVDVLAVDVYNGYGGTWASPRGLLAAPYARLTALNEAAPVWIAELGCREPAKDEPGARADPRRSKADWLSSLFAMTEYPRLESVNFFHADRTHDWRLDSSPAALQVCRTALAGR